MLLGAYFVMAVDEYGNYSDIVYKDNLTKEQYEAIRSTVCGHAIENMFANERDIINMIKIAKNEKTADEIIAEYKKEWGVSV